jgi:hypothetical protein
MDGWIKVGAEKDKRGMQGRRGNVTQGTDIKKVKRAES